ncbi:MAG: hypothetical protein LBU34_15580 [Planctomycetaceae bacterium]|nr:hypothetical protein [Planctomycetaceae bacterium]
MPIGNRNNHCTHSLSANADATATASGCLPYELSIIRFANNCRLFVGVGILIRRLRAGYAHHTACGVKIPVFVAKNFALIRPSLNSVPLGTKCW